MACFKPRKMLFRAGLCAVLGGLIAANDKPLEPVDLELVIATDASFSVDNSEAKMQRDGAVAAFRSPEVVHAIQSGALGKIAVAYIDFSNPGANRVVVNWALIHDRESADQFADAIARARRTDGVQTSISSGIEMAVRIIENNKYDGTKKVIDVSGDGPNNEGHFVDKARDEAVAKGMIINGLPIMTEADKFDAYYLPDLDKYYAGCVIGGPGSFIHIAHGFADLARALRHKLVQEISDARPPRSNPLLFKVAAGDKPRTNSWSHPVYEKGCDIGERMRYGGFSQPDDPAPTARQLPPR
jgi:uncharacterized protein DUF1194